ncbi:sugar ABC transporter ATP-binding protein [Donghicola sp. B5-SW-15]|uniref:Sugar ABC transporter ATP-binding protein n=2 Tax=Donghicola mangrovi TaxID=2729614 RepID=A0A850Q8E6_9RHOB|nr:sugar ABC transporter ATP-binding protein [Donghicola mangrovi]
MLLKSVAKTFPNGTIALRGVDLDVAQGKVHGLLGANGAGKSTLIKILSGSIKATGGTIIWRGQEVSWNTPKEANDIGIATVHQHIPLVPTLSVLENVFLGKDELWRKSKSIYAKYDALCEQVNYRIEPNVLVSELSIGARQMLAIIQALATGADLIVLDEPTASLAAEERELVYSVVRRLSKVENKAILFVSHFLDEVLSLTDQVTILRDGQAVLRAETSQLDEDTLAEAIVGKAIAKLEHEAEERESFVRGDDEPRLSIRNLRSEGKFASVDLEVAKGEVIGIAGLLGSGRSEFLHAIYGADPQAKGEVLLDGKLVPRSPGGSVEAGMGLVPEDRLEQGLVPDFEIWRNLTLPILDRVSAGGFFPIAKREFGLAVEAIKKLGIKADSPEILVSELSGGNAQKVTIARWLFTDVKVFLLDEPTAGIDIGAKTDILRLVRELAAEGRTVIIVSSEFEELLAVSDRILAMRDGTIVAERNVHETSEHDLLLLCSGEAAATSNEAYENA